jgi:hypothetical protein
MLNKETKKTALGLNREQKSPYPYIFASLFTILILIVGFVVLKNNYSKVNYKMVQIGSETFKLEVADTQASREKGLSERDSISKNGGMLFDFKTDGNWRIWMVQMRFPNDVLWLNSSGQIIHIKQNAQPADYPEVYHADSPSRYVIELASGTVLSQGLKVGNTIKLQ